jgi:hypothetical protein
MTAEKLSENRVRRLAERRGLRIARSRARDPRAFDYGRYMLKDVNTRVIVAGASSIGRALWTLEDVESYLAGTGRGAS